MQLTPSQTNAYNNLRKFDRNIIFGDRCSGLTIIMCEYLLDLVVSKDNLNILVLSFSNHHKEFQRDIFYKHIQEVLEQQYFKYKKDEKTLQFNKNNIKLKNNTINFSILTPHIFRGVKYSHIIFLDSTYIKKPDFGIIEEIMYSLSENGKIIFTAHENDLSKDCILFPFWMENLSKNIYQTSFLKSYEIKQPNSEVVFVKNDIVIPLENVSHRQFDNMLQLGFKLKRVKI